MSNLIDRQQAIDALKEAFNPSITNFVKAKMAIDNLPSAQPEKRTEERTETHACDSISRQAAIDGKICIQRANGVEIYDDYAVPVEYLKQLPSVQPETTTMTVGRTKGEITMWYECDNCGEPVDQSDNYCRNCGRRFKKDE